jgi:hypothetical protein
MLDALNATEGHAFVEGDPNQVELHFYPAE